MHLSLPSRPRIPRFVAGPAALATTVALLLGGCTAPGDAPTGEPGGDGVPVSVSTSDSEPGETVTDSGLPHDALPEVPGGRENRMACPYLDTQWVAETNGQRMTGMGVDERFDTPACVFWSYPENPQLQVIVRKMPDEEAAVRVVDWAAPVDFTEPAEEPEGWSGGRAGGGMVPDREGAVYAVQKGDRAVVVFTNQEQSLKAELVAREVIANLGL